jgi:DNA-binding CsgD family transcriptional regulator
MIMFYEDDNILQHYGMPRRSGRYPWGSGEDPYQRTGDFLSRVEDLKKTGWTETPENIKKEFGLSTKEYRMEKSMCNDQRKLDELARIRSLKEDGLSTTEIGRIMGKNESSIRSALESKSEARIKETQATVQFLKERVKEVDHGMVDVGLSAEKELNISKERLDLALYYLKEKEGYEVWSGGIPQPTNPGQQTTQKVLCKPGTPHKAIYEYDKVASLKEYISRDGGDTFEKKFNFPESLDSKRLKIRYDEEGGTDKDGIIELRRGVDDLSLGESRYSQVRIMVDNTHYLKGVAVYSDNMPDGVDVIFNTNKKKGTPQEKVLKELKRDKDGNIDQDNPFGSLIKDADQGGQYWYTDKSGNKKLGLINKRADEGDWTEWQDALPSQFLGKQSLSMAKKQLNLAKVDKQAEFDDICSLNNPTIKKHLLSKFADECDSAAVHLKAAALPGQKYHVIIPVNTLKENEVYAPGYKDGTKLALIRYPHGGTFEIPILTVNNKHAAAKKLIGTDVVDAVGITKKVADKLSGADFDGDTVMCIPTHDKAGRVKIASRDSLPGLEGFDPKLEYPERAGMKYMKDPKTGKDNTQNEMGRISNLITDMTLAGAKDHELAAAVRHSMVVIDAGKHKLDYKQSEKDNNIAALKKKYQIGVDKNGDVKYGGAATILSRAKGQATVDRRQGTPKVNQKGKEWYDPNKPEGSLIYKTADDLYFPVRKTDKTKGEVTYTTTNGKKITYRFDDKKAAEKYAPVKNVDPHTGKVTYTSKDGSVTYKLDKKTQKSTNMAETDNAETLMSAARHPMERVYADYANSMKSLANQARLEQIRTGKIAYSASAKATYINEVNSLNKKLNDAELNKTRERAALRYANADVSAKKLADPNMSKSDIKKANQRAVSKYRAEVGAVSRRDRNIDITDREWEAIQAGAISENTLTKILNNTDTAKLRERATPRTKAALTDSQVNRIKAMKNSSFTIEQIAAKFGVSPSTVSKYMKGA